MKWRRSQAPAEHQYDFIFVVTFGRSGSTLVQGLLNTMPRTLVRGENGFYVAHLFRASAAAEDLWEQRHDGARAKNVVSAFYGIRFSRPERFVKSFRALILANLFGPEDRTAYDRVGFKEVHWHQIEPDETEAFFTWFEKVFPGARYILNTRDMEAAAGSGFWQRRDADANVAAMARVLEIQQFLRETRPDQVIETRYEEITSDDDAVSDKALRAFATSVLGSCSDEIAVSLSAALDVGYGPNPFGASRRDQRRERRRKMREQGGDVQNADS